MTPRLRTRIPSSVWLTKGRLGLTVSAHFWTNMTQINAHVRCLCVCMALYCTRGIDCKSLFCCKLLCVCVIGVDVCVCVICVDVCVCVCVCVFVVSSPWHGWTGRVWSHERTIHEDRGGLPARLLSHWQGEVSDSSHHVQPHNYVLASLRVFSFFLFAHLCLLFTMTHSLSPLLCLRSTRAINLAPIVSLGASCTSGPSRCCSCCHFLLFSKPHHHLILFSWIHLIVHLCFYLKLISRMFPLAAAAQSYERSCVCVFYFEKTSNSLYLEVKQANIESTGYDTIKLCYDKWCNSKLDLMAQLFQLLICPECNS